MSGSWHDILVILGVSYLTELGLNLDFSKKIQRRFNSRFVGGWGWLRSSGRKTEEWLFWDADVISSSRILRIGPENIYLRNVGSRFQVVNFKKTMDWLNEPNSQSFIFHDQTCQKPAYKCRGVDMWLQTSMKKTPHWIRVFEPFPWPTGTPSCLFFSFAHLMRHFPITISQSSLLRRGIRRRGANLLFWKRTVLSAVSLKTHQRMKETGKNSVDFSYFKNWKSLGIWKNLESHLPHWFTTSYSTTPC